MDTEVAIATKIRPWLDDTFGRRMTNYLITVATLVYVTTPGGEKERYDSFVRAICANKAVVRMWGEAAAARQEKEWRDLYDGPNG
ncbi:MAG: hypothetical protein ACE5LG_04420 [Anaerolineae bacterium]